MNTFKDDLFGYWYTGERSSGLLIVERNRELENRYSKYVDSLVIYVFIYLFIYFRT